MKRFKRIGEKIKMHPIMAFLIMTAFVIVLSGILDVFDASVTYNKVNLKTGGYESTLVTVESLLNLSGIKYIFSNTVSNFVSFTPLSMLLIVLIGISIMDRSGFLDTIFFLLTKNMPKTAVTFIFTLICIMTSITGDLCFVVMIPLEALLFKYGKRNPKVGIISAFAALSLGYGMNILISSTDSTMITSTEQAARIISTLYSINSSCFIFIMIPATLIGAALITYVTERIIAPKLGKYEDEEEIIQDKEKLTRREVKGLLFAGIGALIYLIIFIYNIIPNAPLGGNLLDYSQNRYIDKLFGYDSFFNSGFVFVITFLFFLCGLLYGIGTKTVKNHRDICDYLSHSLDGIGKVIVLLFCASTFISLLKYTNIGTLITAYFANIIFNSSFTNIPLLILVLFVSIISAILLPSFVSRWNILSGSIVPVMMSSGFSAEFAQLVFTVGSSLIYPLTPVMAYFVIYISFLEKYDKEGIGVARSIRYMIPYCLIMLGMWFILLLLWYVIGIPLGLSSGSVL
ncbi:MAG: AbgT family transporter [Erysipelotrichales bacterium]|nr:AbgT family transporter [Erysipelotrichales bacterium]